MTRVITDGIFVLVIQARDAALYGVVCNSSRQEAALGGAQKEETMKSLAFLEQVNHDRKVAIYTAVHDGKMRNFAYYEDLGECRETFARLFQDVQ